MARQTKPPDEPVTRPPRRTVVPVIEETVRAGTRRVITGRVRVNKRVEEHTEKVEVPITRAEVEVRRVPVNRPIDKPVPVKEEGDTVIIPVMEEEVVTTKRLVLKEEIHVTTRRTSERHRELVRLRRERANVERAGS